MLPRGQKLFFLFFSNASWFPFAICCSYLIVSSLEIWFFIILKSDLPDGMRGLIFFWEKKRDFCTIHKKQLLHSIWDIIGDVYFTSLKNEKSSRWFMNLRQTWVVFFLSYKQHWTFNPATELQKVISVFWKIRFYNGSVDTMKIPGE